MEKQDSITDEIVIVGSRHGGLADIVKPIYEKGAPIEEKNIRKLLGDDEVVISPEDNHFDAYAVGVYTIDLKPIGHVWMCQAPALRRWLKLSGRKYLKARITRVCVKAGVLMARCDSGLRLEETERIYDKIDLEWAEDVPEVLTSLTEQSLGLGLHLLRDELEESKSWSPRLQMRIDNLLRYLPLDLSGHHYRDCIDLYKIMIRSNDAEVRVQGEFVLASFVHRGSPDHMKWWVENWLPDFFRDAAESDLLGIFESADYTLEMVEALLKCAPANLYHLYQVNRERFVRQLYYSALPQPVYNRLLTLLAVREAMIKKGGYSESSTSAMTMKMRKAIKGVQSLMWGNAAYGYLFGVCRDDCGYPDNMSLFERDVNEIGEDEHLDYLCPEGTISRTFKNNDFLRLHVDKWKDNGAKKRGLKLVDYFRNLLKE